MWRTKGVAMDGVPAAKTRNAEALKLQEEVLPLRRKKLGAEHPDTLGAMTNLAKAYDNTGKGMM